MFFAHDISVLSYTISSAINYIGFGFIKPNASPLSIYFCIEGTFKKIVV
jgi:hypothetical protein